ncbi:UNC-50 family protein [Lentithecium fluviatile CBS 122367]|uniref:UNC-50 family protein n=1 Tax=Lentithecium fluviatile CBS 122367 TaxID=1168545 RepID=A0A6G1J6E4_9PLEO|nr:UNC-50 family protein [Lentithecium fluviatile CBS 122367]
MNPHISLPRPTDGPSNFGSTPSSRRNELRMPRFFKRLFKFPQMDFEMAIWEMMSLIIAPKKVFRSIYYHKQTSKTYHRPDPSFTYLLSAFQLLTSLAWGFAYADGFPRVIRVALVFIFVHFLLLSLVTATLFFFLIKYLLGPNSKLIPGRRRGLYDLGTENGEGSQELEFGYCWDVAIRAFVPVWLFLYVVQFLCMPLVGTDHWVSLALSNTLYLIALNYYFIITFLGYNALPFLHHTELLLAPIAVTTILWFASLFGMNLSKHLAPVFLTGARLRKGN